MTKQELLAWLLDQLHEDLNRAAPAAGMGQAQEPAEKQDQIAATTAWEQHTARNKSIVTELFYGQLKSKVRCDTCGHESVRFDAFNMLSLPLPLESALHVTVTVILLDGSVPVQYGVRVAAEGTVLDLKRSVAERSGLPPDKMLVVESASATLGRALDDSTRLRQRAYTLYEVPASTDAVEDTSLLDLDVEQPAPAAEVSAPRSALCMPALFCFKRSRSEILMSQSPPGFYEPRPSHTTANDVRCNTLPEPRPSQTLANDVRCNTLPKNLRPGGNCSPTLSVKSLNLRPNSPRLGKAKFGSSPSNMHQLNETKREVPVGEIHYLVAVHRKQCRLDSYFLPSQRCRPALFGAPLLVPVGAGGAGGGGRALYAAVWAQVRRLLSPRPPRADTSNHAADCDDSLGYEYPFTLRLVDRGGMWCGRCPWSRLCRGCPIASHPPAGTPLSEKRVSSTASVESDTDSGLPDKHSRQYSSDGCSPCASAISSLDLGLLQALRRRGREPALAVDWDPTALHLRYQTTREKAYIEHSSVRSVAAEAARPIDLDHCLSAFTAEERLEQPYHCDGCRSAQPATKKLQIWRLPPILIVHLKRFQYVNNKWIKSQKVVNFPFEDFDPTAYLASVPQETILRHKELLKRTSTFHEDPISESETDDEAERDGDKQDVKENHVKQNREKRQRDPMETRARKRLESSSLVTTPVMDDNLIDYHQHHLLKGQDPFDLKYRLYAVVSHSGQLSGGHYVAYARNPSGAWLCYNDSSCRELPAPHIDPATAYLLFYERQGLDPDRYLPDVTGKQPCDV
ncbi:hypothetical protein JYU34_012311 [Plutella xylostella]|uniref:ubiquitinyl hydrolase 1 n=1 Tax=Plutella xylostella TaxID=51655 RepID=A0ABQ7QII1_PLUXY|nr:hypothetical protein JYU34_012311 [Plutella xylostella]